MVRAGRLLDAGLVSPLRSISLFHTVARALRPGDAPTLILVRPADPFVLVGYHQVRHKEVDLEACRELGLPVLRRQVGGGAVYLDRHQLFFHLVLPEAEAPRAIAERYARYSRPCIEMYRRFGVEASFRPVNDIQVRGRKIGGTGGATIGAAAVFVGSVLMDFDHETMARVLRVPDEKMRDKVYQSLREYVTTMRRELGGRLPSLEEIKAELVARFEATLGVRLTPGGLREDEAALLPAVEAELLSPAFLDHMDAAEEEVRQVKIMEGVYVREAAYKAPGGLIRVTLRTVDGRIDDLLISGDFYAHPPAGLDDLRRALLGAPVADAERRIEAFLAAGRVQVPGVTAADVARALQAAAG